MRKCLIVTLSLLLITASTGANALGPTNTGNGDRIVFDLSQQRVWLVNETKSVVHTYLVSGSKYPEHHNAGTYKVFSKSRKTSSLLGIGSALSPSKGLAGLYSIATSVF